MPKKNNWLPNVRVDIPDMEHGTHGYLTSVTQEVFEQFIKDDYSRVINGFRVVIADQGTSPGLFTIYNGAALDQDGTLVTNGEDLAAQRSATITSNATYYVEIELLETESDVESRGVWDPTFDNGQDDSGDDLPDGKEFAQNVATRITQDWQIVTPISTSGFQLSSNRDSTRIPICILTVAGGVISGASTAPARTCLLESCSMGATSIRMVNTKNMPAAFTATLDVGGANQETITVTANDTKNGVLTVSGGTANAQTAGARLVVAGASPAQFLTERTAMSPSIATAAGDARMRLWQGNEDRGYVLGQNPLAATGNSDVLLATLKDQIDFLSAQFRELKFGYQRAVDAGKLAPPDTFSSEPRYFDRASGVLGAKTFITIGDGAVQWGDFNRTAYASDDLLLEAAIAALPADGGTIFIKPGFTLDNFAGDVDIPADTKVRFMSDNYRNKNVFNIDSTDVASLFDCTTGTTHGKVTFENISWKSDNASPMLIKIRDNWDLDIVGSAFVADGEGAVAIIDYLALTTGIGRTNIESSSFEYTSDGTAGANGRGFVDATDKLVRNMYVSNCDFVFSNANATATDRLFRINDCRNDVRFVDCTFTVNVADEAGVLDLESTDSTGDNVFGRLVAGCVFDSDGAGSVTPIGTGTPPYLTGLTVYGCSGSTAASVENSFPGETNFTSNVVIGGTTSSTGLITATAGLTAAANQHITISGTGRYKHGTLVRIIPGSAAQWREAGSADEPPAPLLSRAGTFGHPKFSAAGQMYVPLVMDLGQRIKAFRVVMYNEATAGTRIIRLCRTETSTDNVEILAYDDSTSTSAVVTYNLELGTTGGGSTTLDLTIESGYDYWFEVSGFTDDYFKLGVMDYDRP